MISKTRPTATRGQKNAATAAAQRSVSANSEQNVRSHFRVILHILFFVGKEFRETRFCQFRVRVYQDQRSE